ncbi:MAG: hypothetical protein DSY33_06185 [Archaeoglobus sp.]|jgi:hypothetical protein|nr:MAG: hypothetical protein DSY33_06185 [Archaeoglobus sp.]
MNEDVLKVLVPFLLGCVAGVVSYFVAFGNVKRDPIGIIVLVIFIYMNKFLLPKVGVKSVETKDWLTISAMALGSWYMVWTFLMNI